MTNYYCGQANHRVLLFVGMASIAVALQGCGGGDVEVASTTPDEVSATPMGTVVSSALYQSPVQIRTRYGFDKLPGTPEGKGSGQLIAIISAYNNPDLIANVGAFSARYGIPNCVEVKTAYSRATDNSYTTATVSHPAAGVGCTIQVVNVDSFGRPTTTVAASNSASWNAESSMDAEWAHAIAPGASILIVQAPSPFVGALANAVNYASKVAKADVVSISWGAAENSVQCTRRPGQPTVKYDASCSDAATASAYWNNWNAMFSGPSTYVAASGDRATLQWPSIQNNVLAVGGTVVSSTTETGWTGSGGGLSASYASTPAQQLVTKQVQRAVPDVAYDAGTLIAVYIKPNSLTGYADATCVKANGVANCGWYGAGGTSAGAPQWAGIAAINNATRIAKRASSINFMNTIYTIAAIPADYMTAFVDIVSGAAGSNTSKVGYDLVTGLGVPDTSVLISYLSLQ